MGLLWISEEGDGAGMLRVGLPRPAWPAILQPFGTHSCSPLEDDDHFIGSRTRLFKLMHTLA